MFLVANAFGKQWDGFGWNQKGKEFLTPASAVRSLQEEGEDLEQITFHFTSIYSSNDPQPTISRRSASTS
jgi:hypothetical protein